MERTLGCCKFDPETNVTSEHPELNPLLEHEVTSETNLFGRIKRDNQDLNQFATAYFARLLASAFIGGAVIEVPGIGDQGNAGSAHFSVPMRLVQYDTADGPQVFVAGNVARELGIDYHNWNQRSGDICRIMGVPYIPGLAEGLFDACVKAGLVPAAKV